MKCHASLTPVCDVCSGALYHCHNQHLSSSTQHIQAEPLTLYSTMITLLASTCLQFFCQKHKKPRILFVHDLINILWSKAVSAKQIQLHKSTHILLLYKLDFGYNWATVSKNGFGFVQVPLVWKRVQ